MAFGATEPDNLNANLARSAVPQLQLPSNFRFVTVTAVVLSHAQRRRYRAAYNDMHSTLRDMVARNFGVQPYEMEGYQMHHWLPIGLAPAVEGKPAPHYSPNCIQNIDPVTAADHEHFHQYIIDPQYAHLRPGQVVTLRLPKRHRKSRPQRGCQSEYGLAGGR